MNLKRSCRTFQYRAIDGDIQTFARADIYRKNIIAAAFEFAQSRQKQRHPFAVGHHRHGKIGGRECRQ